MPVVFRSEGATFFFYSNEGDPREPAHIHVRKSGAEAKFWLKPRVQLDRSKGFSAPQLTKLVREVEARVGEIEEAWNDHFSD